MDDFLRPWFATRKKQQQLETLLQPEDLAMYVNLRPYVNEAAVVALQNSNLRRVNHLFLSLGLRHLLVVESCPKLVGVITRKDILSAGEPEPDPAVTRASSGSIGLDSPTPARPTPDRSWRAFGSYRSSSAVLSPARRSSPRLRLFGPRAGGGGGGGGRSTRREGLLSDYSGEDDAAAAASSLNAAAVAAAASATNSDGSPTTTSSPGDGDSVVLDAAPAEAPAPTSMLVGNLDLSNAPGSPARREGSAGPAASPLPSPPQPAFSPMPRVGRDGSIDTAL